MFLAVGEPASVKLNYRVSADGKIVIKESLAFTPQKGEGYEVRVQKPQGPLTLGTASLSGDDLRNLSTSSDLLQFVPTLKKPGAFQLSYEITAQSSPVPMIAGSYLHFPPDCRGAARCTITFEGLPPGSSAGLLGRPAERSPEPEGLVELNTKSGNSISFEAAELKGAEMIRVMIAGEAARSNAIKIWEAAPLPADQQTRFRLHEDGSVDTYVRLSQHKKLRYPALAIYYPGDDDKVILLGRLENIERGYVGKYADSYLRPKHEDAELRYAMLDAGLKNANAQPYFLLSLSAAQTSTINLTARQTTAGFISYVKPIAIELPPGMTAQAQLVECLSLIERHCRQARQVPAKTEMRDQTLQITPLEAQVAGLWLVKLQITQGRFSEPRLLTRLAFAFAHYHNFGRHPRWVFWFYAITIIGTIIGLIMLFYYLAKAKHRRVEARQLIDQEARVIEPLLKHDPQFSLDAFKARARAIAEKIQLAWCAGDMCECRRYLSQGVYNRFRLQLKIMRELENRQNAMADFQILRLVVVERHRSGEFEALIVRLDAGARDVMVGTELSTIEATAKAKRAGFQRFTEYYTFMRRRQATTQQKESTDACARCGTPFTAEGEITKCKSCGAVAGSGTFDWVLAEITQASEFRAHAKRVKLSGDVSADRIEDRASFVFWRDIMARLTGNRAFIQRDATDDYLKPGLPREKLSDIAVGAAELEAYDDTAKPIRAKVRIKWSAQASGDAEVRHRQSVITLVAEPKYREHREPNARDNTESVFQVVAGPDVDENSGLAEHSCPSCGAPLPETDSEQCAYCQSTIARRNKDWLLATIKTTVE